MKISILTACMVFALIGCAAKSSGTDARRFETRITPDNATNPKRIRFDVYGDPYSPAPSGSAESQLPSNLRIRAGMRRYAAGKLSDLGYCPGGFSGPDLVMASEGNRMASFFWVECL